MAFSMNDERTLIRFLVSAFIAFQVNAAQASETRFVEIVRVPDQGIQPQVQTDGRGRLHMIYFKGEPSHGDVFHVRSDDGGATFTRPLPVNSQLRSSIAIGTIRGPRIAVGKDERVHVAWMGSEQSQPKFQGKAAPMLYSRLSDAGDGFEPQRNIIQKYPGLDGGGAVAADQEGNVYVAWHAPEHGSDEADRRVWVARSSDNGKTFDPETPASPSTTGVCGCCGLTIAAGLNGRVFVLYRSATERVHRDMTLLASEDRGKTFKVASIDPWDVGICVMSTAHFATARDSLFAVWETQNQIRLLRCATSVDTVPRPVSVPSKGGDRKHPAIAVNGRGEFIAAWAEGTGWNKGGRVAWQVFDKAGQPEAGKAGHADGLAALNVPAVFATRDNAFKVVY